MGATEAWTISASIGGVLIVAVLGAAFCCFPRAPTPSLGAPSPYLSRRASTTPTPVATASRPTAPAASQ